MTNNKEYLLDDLPDLKIGNKKLYIHLIESSFNCWNEKKHIINRYNFKTNCIWKKYIYAQLKKFDIYVSNNLYKTRYNEYDNYFALQIIEKEKNNK